MPGSDLILKFVIKEAVILRNLLWSEWEQIKFPEAELLKVALMEGMAVSAPSDLALMLLLEQLFSDI